MVSAIVLVTTDAGRADAIAEHVAGLTGVSEVYSVSGEFDLVVVVRAAEFEAAAALVAEQVQRVPGIQRTQTLMSFRVYSQADLTGGVGVD